MNRWVIAAAAAALVAPVVSVLARQDQKVVEPTKHFKSQRGPSALVLGRVVDATTNQPIANAVVSMGAREAGRAQTTSSNVYTTDAGYFVFRELPAGSYPLTVVASGYLPGGFGQRRPGGPTQPLTLADAERAGGVTIKLWKEATVSGTVTDAAGDPVASVSLSLLKRSQLSGGPVFRAAISEPVPFARTDASGVYRFTGLLPGEYVVSMPSRYAQLPAAAANADAAALEVMRASGFTGLASGLRYLGPTVRVGDMLIQTSGEGSWGGSNTLADQLPVTLRSDGTVLAYASTFFPGVSSPSQATTIRLAAGDDRQGVDLHLKPVAMTRISGTVTGPSGPLSGFAVHLFPAFAVNSGLERSHAAGVTVSGADGSFAFLGVPAGDYVIKSWRLPQSLVIGTDALPTEPTLWASLPISVSEKPLTGVSVALKPGASIRGRIVQDGTTAPQQPGRLQTALSVAFEPAWTIAFGARLSTRISPAYEFVTQGLPPGEYFPVLPNQFLSPALGWYFESATRAGQDLMLNPIVLESGSDATDVVITLSDKRTTVSGTVTDLNGKPNPNAAVVVFPANYRAWIDRGMPPLAAWSAVASQVGAFSIDIRAGEYIVAAIDESVLENWRRDTVIAALAAQGKRITAARGETLRGDLRAIAVRVP